MNVVEAMRLLEIEDFRGLQVKDVKRVYRKLMREHHPDKGGEVGKAQLLNEAYMIAQDAIKKLKVSEGKSSQAVIVIRFCDLIELYRGKEVSGVSKHGEIFVDRKNIRTLNTYVEAEMRLVVGSYESRFSELNRWNIKDEYVIRGYLDCVDIGNEVDVVVKVNGREIPIRLKDKVILALKYDHGIKLKVIIEKRRVGED